MKTMSKITIGLVAAALLIVGCGDSGKAAPSANAKVAPTITEASLGLRKTDLYSEDTTTGDKTQYSTSAAGSGKMIQRAFQDAPPMIPHDTDGMLPIKIGDNQCTGCHMPEVASSMGATSIPVSHFTNFRPKHKYDGQEFTKSIDNMKNEVAIKESTHLQGARFNCTQCHAPQSQGALAVENTFEATYTRPDGANKSGWSGKALTDQLDTVKGEGGKVSAADIANANSPSGSLGH
ncbi:periplasmic nitrate reductase, small subunit, cytochrome c-type protein [Sulfurimonas gotlandica GD1]|jgi:cytochrome c-type protein NapB|uniref:Periplasmic nitrate reductase, electron transfer subunit n=1 Tax=Sulfurimonas gotlandica (strain DSM 19862 / JCM 16533 / GD1) TaxID=929558 RepID=B6BKR0_SULGG|nr:nitrate reductase cytochrome c-type subunit [Sulfurimonas gotlandica]EDZ62456.1 periplasmic nitrate reductase [Sulfurimonas gotlandica GD1]EHP29119.1 periplasmic nitrate reductase, small subunit, cytochrome c-type protein [Sulfurimonas gotlandica GD1]